MLGYECLLTHFLNWFTFVCIVQKGKILCKYVVSLFIVSTMVQISTLFILVTIVHLTLKITNV